VTHRSTSLRVVGLLVLIAGIIGMHSLIVAPGHGAIHQPQAAAYHLISHAAPQMSLSDACDCNGHNGFHACVFVLNELLTVMGLILLCWLGVASQQNVQARIRQALRRRQRAPPWTILSLAELSLLRI
jgi:urea transporter